MSETMEDDLQAGDDGLYCVGFVNEHLLSDTKLVQQLNRYGHVVSVSSGRRDPPQHPNRKPWSFVRFANPEDAVRAISGLRESPHLCNTKFVKYIQTDNRIMGRAVGQGPRPGRSDSGVSPLVREGESDKADKHEVYIGNWPVNLDQSSIIELFQKFNIKLQDVRLYNKGNHSFAFVVVPTAEDVELAIKSMNGGKVAGQVIKVGCSNQKSTNSAASTSTNNAGDGDASGGDRPRDNKSVHQRLGGEQGGRPANRSLERPLRGGRWQQSRPRGSSADRRFNDRRCSPLLGDGPMPPLVLPGPRPLMDSRPPPIMDARPPHYVDGGPPPLVLPGPPPQERRGPPLLVLPTPDGPLGGGPCPPEQQVALDPREPYDVVYDRVEGPPNARFSTPDFLSNREIDLRRAGGPEQLPFREPATEQHLQGSSDPEQQMRRSEEFFRATSNERSTRGPPVGERLRAQGPPGGSSPRCQPRGESLGRQPAEDRRRDMRENFFLDGPQEEAFRGQPDDPNMASRDREWFGNAEGKNIMHQQSGPMTFPDGAGEPRRVPEQLFTGHPSEEPLRSRPGERPFGGHPDECFRGYPDTEPFRGRPNEEPFRGNPGEEPLRGRMGAEPLRSNAGGEPFRGRPGEDPLQGHPGEEPFRGHFGEEPFGVRHGEESLRGRPGQEPFRGRMDEESFRGRPGGEPPRGVFPEAPSIGVNGRGRGLRPLMGEINDGPGPSRRRNLDMRGEPESFEGAPPFAKRPRYGGPPADGIAERERMPPAVPGAPALNNQRPPDPNVGGPGAGGGRAGAVADRIKTNLRAPTDVVVANFPVGTNERQLMEMFDKYEPLSVRIMVNNSSSHPDDFTYAYLTVANRMAADEAVMEMDGLMFRGRPLVVETKKK